VTSVATAEWKKRKKQQLCKFTAKDPVEAKKELVAI